jgi:putative SOS response-associated peptidase YedK
MPVIFDRLQAKQWLDPRLSTRSADIAADVAPFPSEQMDAHDVSPLVNKPGYDSRSALTRLQIRNLGSCSVAISGASRTPHPYPGSL